MNVVLGFDLLHVNECKEWKGSRMENHRQFVEPSDSTLFDGMGGIIIFYSHALYTKAVSGCVTYNAFKVIWIYLSNFSRPF